MSVEVRPLGVRCNLRCAYCYQKPQRDSGRGQMRYDLDRMRAALEKEGAKFTLFGGEPLLMPHGELEALWAWGLERFGANSVQTNGSLIGPEHIRMFREYRVSVGISIDGPGALNDARWAGTLEATRRATARTEAAIARLCEEGMPPSLIVTLHRGNAAPQHLPVLTDWLSGLEETGVGSVRLHILEVEDAEVRARWALSTRENVAAFSHFVDAEPRFQRLSFDVFADMRRMLRGQDRKATCIWTGCDAYTTAAVQGVEGFGQRSNCGRTNKDGVEFAKADAPGYERSVALYYAPQEGGGCRGCRFFLMCRGQCPGTAIDGDWRNRTEHCEVWRALFTTFEQEIEREGTTPVSRRPDLPDLEREFLAAWGSGRSAFLEDLLAARDGAERG